MNYLDLFSGIGGFHLGLMKAGFQFQWIGFSEIWKPAIELYQFYFPDAVNLGDITKINPAELPEIDICTAGFPCQDISIANTKGKGLSGARSSLFWDIIRICGVHRPKIILLENVKNLLSKNGGKDMYTILNALQKLGYVGQYEVLNSKNFGVPQRRERVFIIGFRDQPAPEIFPLGESDYGNHQTGQKETSTCLSAKNRYDPCTEQFIANTIKVHNQGHTGRPCTDTYISYAICSNAGMPRSKTIITQVDPIRTGETARISRWVDSARFKMLGNAVTIPVIEAIGKKILNALSEV